MTRPRTHRSDVGTESDLPPSTPMTTTRPSGRSAWMQSVTASKELLVARMTSAPPALFSPAPSGTTSSAPSSRSCASLSFECVTAIVWWPVAHPARGDAGPHGRDLAHRLVAQGARELGGDVSLRDVDVGIAETAGPDPDQDLVGARLGSRHLLDFPARVRGRNDGRSHMTN